MTISFYTDDSESSEINKDNVTCPPYSRPQSYSDLEVVVGDGEGSVINVESDNRRISSSAYLEASSSILAGGSETSANRCYLDRRGTLYNNAYNEDQVSPARLYRHRFLDCDTVSSLPLPPHLCLSLSPSLSERYKKIQNSTTINHTQQKS